MALPDSSGNLWRRESSVQSVPAGGRLGGRGRGWIVEPGRGFGTASCSSEARLFLPVIPQRLKSGLRICVLRM